MRRTKGLGIWIAAIIMVLGMALTAYAANEPTQPSAVGAVFKDISDGDQALPYIKYLAGKGIIKGYPDGTYKPNHGLTRAEAAVVMCNAAGIRAEQPAAVTFIDVPRNHWAYNYISAASKAGYLKGNPDNTFRPEQKLTRAEGISLVFRLSKSDISQAALPQLADINNKHWAARPIAAALEAHMVGLSADEKKFFPDAPFTRLSLAKALGVLLTEDPSLYKATLPGTLKPITGKITLKKAGSSTEETVSKETLLSIGDVITSVKGAKAEVNYPDGSSLLIKDNTQVTVKAAEGRKYIKIDGSEGIAVDWLNLDMKKGTMFTALATRQEGGEANTEPASGTAQEKTSSLPPVLATLASTNFHGLLGEVASNTPAQQQQWYKIAQTKKVKVQVDMPWGVAAVRGTFVLISVDESGHSSISCLTGTAEVTAAGQTMPLTENQATQIVQQQSPPETKTEIKAEEVKQFIQENVWVKVTAQIMDEVKEAAPPEPDPVDTTTTITTPTAPTTPVKVPASTIEAVDKALKNAESTTSNSSQKQSNNSGSSEPTIVSVDNVEATVIAGDPIKLPDLVTAHMSDNTTRQVAVVWNTQAADYSKPGYVRMEGSVSGYSSKVYITFAIQRKPGEPVAINTLEDLAAVSTCPADSYTLMRDLDFNNDASYFDPVSHKTAWTTGTGWTPIASFTGKFYGNNHTISNLQINSANSQLGLFSEVTCTGQIRNLGLIDVNITGANEKVGAVAGLLSEQASILNCYSTGSISANAGAVGGVVGENSAGIIIGCHSSAAISGASEVGGISGKNTGSGLLPIICNCYSTGNVVGTSYYIGGITGQAYAGYIVSCYAAGSVTGFDYVGGLVGNMSAGVLQDSYALNESVSAIGSNADHAGSLTGAYYAIISGCYSNSGMSKTASSFNGIDGTNITLEEAKQKISYLNTGWSIDTAGSNTNTIWVIDEGNSLPTFKIQNYLIDAAPAAVALTVGSTNPVTDVTNVALLPAWATDFTGKINGWANDTADTIAFTVTDSGEAHSTITINDLPYTSGTDYVITSPTPIRIVVTTSETGKNTCSRTFVISVNDISSSFIDPNFRNEVWYWLTGTWTVGPFTKQDLINRMPAKNYCLDVRNREISNLAGLENFEGTGIKTLYCNDNLLTSLPVLPSTLQFLECGTNELIQLPALPDSLTELHCYNNRLVDLPALPAGLQTIQFFNNQIKTMPVFPDGMTGYISCEGNYLTSLPTLPPNLEQPIACPKNYINSDTLGSGNTNQYRYVYTGSQLNLQTGEKQQLTGLDIERLEYLSGTWGSPVSGIMSDFIFISSDDSLATADSMGLIQAVTQGSCEITALFKGINAEYTRVTIPVTVTDSSPNTRLTSSDYTISGSTIIVPAGTTKDTFLASLVPGNDYQTLNNNAVQDPVSSGDTLVVTAQNGTSKTYNIIDYSSDISGTFTDPAFKQTIWNWLGYTGTPGSFTKQNLIDKLAAQNNQLKVNSCAIRSLAGIENFIGTNLSELICYSNKLVSLPVLPAGLTSLSCENNSLTSLPALPAGLTHLICSDNQLTSLPALPASLTYLDCSRNMLTSLPGNLPAALETQAERNFINIFTEPLKTQVSGNFSWHFTPQCRFCLDPEYPNLTLTVGGCRRVNPENGWCLLPGRESYDGDTWQDYADYDFFRKHISYSSSDNSIATVDSDGRITAVGSGACNIYALLGGIDSEYTRAIIPVIVND